MPIVLRVSDRSSTDPAEFQFDQSTITLGRSSDNDLALPDQRISGRHARVVKEGGSCHLHDLGSKNHTYVNGVRIGEEPYPIQTGDRIRIGSYVIEFELNFIPANASTATQTNNPFLEPAVRFANSLQHLVEEYVFADPDTRDDDLFDILDRILNAGEVEHPAIDAVREALRQKKDEAQTQPSQSVPPPRQKASADAEASGEADAEASEAAPSSVSEAEVSADPSSESPSESFPRSSDGA